MSPYNRIKLLNKVHIEYEATNIILRDVTHIERSDTKANVLFFNCSLQKCKALSPHFEKTVYIVVPFFTVHLSQRWYT